MLNKKINKLKLGILSFLFISNSFGYNFIKEEIIAKEVQNIIKIEEKNSKLRKLGYFTASSFAAYYFLKDYYFFPETELQKKEKLEAQKAAKLIEASAKEFAKNVHENFPEKEEDKRSESKIPGETKIIKTLARIVVFLADKTIEEQINFFINISKLFAKDKDAKKGIIQRITGGIWNTGTSVMFQLALAGVIAWTSKNFYKHFMPLNYEYFINHYTTFDTSIDMVNACTILDQEKAKDPDYIELSKENLKLAYEHLVKNGHKVIAFMTYTRNKSQNLNSSTTVTTFNNLIENFKNNLNDISSSIDTYNVIAIKNRLAALNNICKMFNNLEAALDEN